MGTRGFVGIKRNGIIRGKYNHSDSYYNQLGKAAVEWYFTKDKKLFSIVGNPLEPVDNDEFLRDGLYCEYGYVYDEDKDVLEVYRGFFSKPQWSKIGYKSAEKETYYTHLVFIIDRQKNSYEQAIRAMEHYDEVANARTKDDSTDSVGYPEREIIPFTFKRERASSSRTKMIERSKSSPDIILTVRR